MKTPLKTPLKTPKEPFVHYCHCGKWGSFGYPDGKWYCGKHRPIPEKKEKEKSDDAADGDRS
jgi:hypothetical protein